MSCGIKRIIKFNQAISAQPIKIFDNIKQDITYSCMFSWSTDSVCWSAWTSYDNYLRITKNIETDFYLRVLISTGLTDVILDNCITTDYTISVDSSNIFLTDFCGETNLFQPYNNLDCALQLQQQLADSVVCMFGIPVYYFRSEPRKDTADYTFKEYVLHNIVDVKQIKLMIKEGAMPSSNPKLTVSAFNRYKMMMNIQQVLLKLNYGNAHLLILL